MAKNTKVQVKDYSKSIERKMNAAQLRALDNYGKNWKSIVKRIITEKDIIDTHRMIDSMDYKIDTGNKTIKTGTDVPYAVFQELGTYKMKARPFLVPSLDEANGALVKILSQEVGDELSSTQGLSPEIYEL